MRTHIFAWMRLIPVIFLIAGGVFTGAVPAHAADPSTVPAFDGTGELHDIRANRVIINDVLHRLAPDVVFKSQDAQGAVRVRLRRGDRVGYVKGDKGRIVELWRLIEAN